MKCVAPPIKKQNKKSRPCGRSASLLQKCQKSNKYKIPHKPTSHGSGPWPGPMEMGPGPKIWALAQNVPEPVLDNFWLNDYHLFVKVFTILFVIFSSAPLTSIALRAGYGISSCSTIICKHRGECYLILHTRGANERGKPGPGTCALLLLHEAPLQVHLLEPHQQEISQGAPETWFIRRRNLF